MTYYSLGSSKYANAGNLSGSGYGFSGGYTHNFFSVSAGFDHFQSKKFTESLSGKDFMEIKENYFRYQVGAALPHGDGNLSFHASVLFGFLSGIDKVKLYHEYSNGMISYGIEKNTGVYKALRSLVPLFSFQGGVLLKSRYGVFVSFDYIKQKKKDLFEFRDDNEIKNSYIAVNGETSSGYKGFNDLSGFKINAGLIFYLGKSE
ncbi:MAG: hypothetical protein V4622_08005 [Bacteroidota bacterium]